MGAIDSADLFGLDELILFAFYWAQRARYRNVVDIGANLGLHSIVMDRCGFAVRSYEPDPEHFRILTSNLAANSCTRVSPTNAAVSSDEGEAEFVRVLGNTTSSHLSGSKEHPYGELQRFNVTVAAIRPLMAWADLVKMDVEGHERQIVCGTTAQDWERTDMVLEVGSPDNAREIFDHCALLNLSMFAQRSGWSRVTSQAEMPTSYRDGSLFISRRDESPWSVATSPDTR
jgi:FkbM family methyltransferase